MHSGIRGQGLQSSTTLSSTLAYHSIRLDFLSFNGTPSLLHWQRYSSLCARFGCYKRPPGLARVITLARASRKNKKPRRSGVGSDAGAGLVSWCVCGGQIQVRPGQDQALQGWWVLEPRSLRPLPLFAREWPGSGYSLRNQYRPRSFHPCR